VGRSEGTKIVQFAGTVTPEIGYQICDAMLEWIADPAHATVWPVPERFIIDMVPDVVQIAQRAGHSLQRHPVQGSSEYDRFIDQRYNWVEAVTKTYMPHAPLLALYFARRTGEEGFARVLGELPGLAFREFRQIFIDGDIPLKRALSYLKKAYDCA
jgi:hypothetical protein